MVHFFAQATPAVSGRRIDQPTPFQKRLDAGQIAAEIDIGLRLVLPAPGGQDEPLELLRRHSDLPLAVGFGIKDADSAAAVAGVADGVVIGSALVSRLAEARSEADACEQVRAFLAPIRAAMDNSAP